MSQQLTDLLNSVQDSTVLDKEEVVEVITNFLDIRLKDLYTPEKGPKWAYYFITNYLSTSFDIPGEKVEECTIRDIMQLISHMPNLPLFTEAVNREKWPGSIPDIRNLAGAMVSSCLLEVAYFSKRIQHYASRFCKITMMSLYHLGLPVTYKGPQLTRITGLAKQYLNLQINERTTLGDLISAESVYRGRMWLWAFKDIDDYMDEIIKTSWILHLIVRDVIKCYVPSSITEFERILRSCGYKDTDEEINDYLRKAGYAHE